MSESRRVQRVEKELQHIVAKYLLRGFKGHLQGLVSVSRVESNPKLRTAKVFVSIMGSEEQKEASLESLQEHVHDIQRHVSRELRMKYIPRISIVLDKGLLKLLHVETLLRQIAPPQKKTSSSRDEEE